MMARLSPGKGHEEVLQAAGFLNREFKHLKFLIVGTASEGEDAYAESVKNLAEELKLTNIIFAGFRTDTADVLSAMDIFLFPSHSEALGIALIEAMAMERASVCSNSDGVLDLAFHQQNALLFEKRNAVDLAEKCRILIQSEAVRKQYGKAAREFVVKNLDIEILTDKVVNLYREAIALRQ
jgi:glycosyltransferase involved in cell wall biosynthesis